MSIAVEELSQGAAGPVLRDCIATLEQVAEYRLPPAIDRRLVWLSENKDRLTSEERDELLALVDMADERTIAKVRARATLQRLSRLFPQLASNQP